MTPRTVRPRVAVLALVSMLLVAAFGAAMATGCAGATPAGPEPSAVFVGASWPEGESLAYQVVDTAGEVIGAGTLEVATDGDALALHQRYQSTAEPLAAAPARDEITLWVHASTLSPLHGERTTTTSSESGARQESHTWTYETDEDGDPLLRVTDGDDEDTMRLREHHYDNESSLWLWRGVAFEEGMEASYVSVNALDESQQTVLLRVPQTETVTVPAGEFETYRLLLRSGRAVRTAWVEAAPPHRVVRWDNGNTILELLED